jgi:hypothetical protein
VFEVKNLTPDPVYFTLSRTQWGIRYRSGKFYDNLADQAVSDDIEFLMKIVAKK